MWRNTYMIYTWIECWSDLTAQTLTYCSNKFVYRMKHRIFLMVWHQRGVGPKIHGKISAQFQWFVFIFMTVHTTQCTVYMFTISSLHKHNTSSYSSIHSIDPITFCCLSCYRNIYSATAVMPKNPEMSPFFIFFW